MKTQEHTAGPWHTPGPWELTNDGFSVIWVGRNSVGEITCCGRICSTAHNIKTRTRENQANARLIAAAPQLLEALESADRLLTQCLTVLHDKAIADRIPFGLLDDVKHFVIKNVGTDAVRSAKGETL